MNKTEYTVEIDANLRVRFMIRDPQPHPHAGWSVQLEMYHRRIRRWRWIVRWDDAGGTPHRDRFGIAHHERLPLPADRGEAAQRALEDLRRNVDVYTRDYEASGEAEGRT